MREGETMITDSIVEAVDMTQEKQPREISRLKMNGGK
jgi:hypothetical protein